MLFAKMPKSILGSEINGEKSTYHQMDLIEVENNGTVEIETESENTNDCKGTVNKD